MSLIALNSAVFSKNCLMMYLLAGTWVPAFFASTPQQVLRELQQLEPAKRFERYRLLVEQYGIINGSCSDLQAHKNVVHHYQALHAQEAFCELWRKEDPATYVRFYEQYFSAVAYCFVLSVQEVFVHRHNKKYCAVYLEDVELWYAYLHNLLPYLSESVYAHRYKQQMTRYQSLCALLHQEIV